MIPEYTVRSIMGDYGGNVAVFTIFKDGTTSYSNLGFLPTKAVIALAAIVIGWFFLYVPLSALIYCCCCAKPSTSKKPKTL